MSRAVLRFLLFCLVIQGQLFGFAINLQVTQDPICLYLTWHSRPDTTMVVRWVTQVSPKEDRFFYRRADADEWLAVKSSKQPLPECQEELVLHGVELEALEPNTDYLFRLADQKIYRFRTAPANLVEPLRFIAGGDLYHDSEKRFAEMCQVAAAQDPLFVLMGGDLAYATSSGELSNWTEDVHRWLEFLKILRDTLVSPTGRLIPVLPVLGNHEVRGRFGQTPSQAKMFYTLFGWESGEGYRTVDFGGYLSLFLLDSGHTHPIAGEQTEWLKEELSARWEIPHKFALYHIPAYPSVRRYTYEHSRTVRRHWVPLFEQFHLTAAFENHDHAFKRTHPIRNGRIDSQGVIYLGDGAWGVTKPRQAPDQRWYIASQAPIQHIILVTLTPLNRRYQAIERSGQIYDDVMHPLATEKALR